MANDNGYLVLDIKDREKLLSENANIKNSLNRLLGGIDFIRGVKRWCLLIEDKDLPEASSVNFIKDRLEKVRNYRLKKKIKMY